MLGCASGVRCVPLTRVTVTARPVGRAYMMLAGRSSGWPPVIPSRNSDNARIEDSGQAAVVIICTTVSLVS